MAKLGSFSVFPAIGTFSRLVALPHSVFALPFALAAYVLAARAGALTSAGERPAATLAAVILAVVAARTAAMGFNRIADADIDRLNPRTAAREIPSGVVTTGAARGLIAASTAVFLGATYSLGVHCLMMAPLVLLVLFGYSFTKRFTEYSHLVLGLALALAPAGAWWVLRPQVELTPVVLMLAVLFWGLGSSDPVALPASSHAYSLSITARALRRRSRRLD